MNDDGSKTPTRTSSNFDDDGRHSDSETQCFDSQPWSPKFHGGNVEIGDENESSQSTMPMNDTVVFEEAFETQVVDLAGETQVMDFGCETQVVDFGGDTQVLDDVNFIEDMETQLLDSFRDEEVRDIDGEVSDSTEVVSDSDDERKCGDLFEETAEVKCSFATTPQDSVKPKNGSAPKRFTSVRAASLRASGLAAQRTALKGSKSVSSSIPISDHLSRKFDVTDNAVSAMNLGKEGDRERDLGRSNVVVNGSRNESTCRDSNLAARKLCYGDENEEHPNNTGKIGSDKDLTKFPACNLAGLSYVGSQEPGDLSQANALDFVDRFLKEFVSESDEEIGRGKSTGQKSICRSAVNGAQKLAKKVNKKSMADGFGIFDWDDNREDEGGGDILRRINRDLSGGGSLGGKPLRGGTGIFNSDSKLLSHNLNVTNNASVCESKSVFSRNLVDELNAESDIVCPEKQLENNATTTDARFDTQMAAEAMEALFFGEGIADRKWARPSDEDLATRLSKKSRSVDDILNSTSDRVTITKSQKAKDNGCKTLEKMPGENTRKRHGRPPKSAKKSLDECDSTTTPSRGGGFSLDKQHKEERVGSSGPIARRTRWSTSTSDSGSKVFTSSDTRVRKTKTIKSDLNKEFEKATPLTNSKEIDTLSCPTRRRRSARNLSSRVDISDKIDDPPESSVHPEVAWTGTTRKRSCRETRSSVKKGLDDGLSLRRSAGVVSTNAESPREKSRLSNSPCTTPVNCKIPAIDVSPVCVSDEYLTQSRARSQAKRSVLSEIRKLCTTEPRPISPSKDLRKRRDITDVRVLYSRHLDEDVIKHQKKILGRLGVSVASSMEDATHFIADHFVRTRNMLEAIACGKPVVTHLWLESCGQANCFIDEKHYILRDAKKEKEFGFSMPNSLACASQHPLLQGLRILITPNTKPGFDVISNLVKVVGGQAVERVGRSALKDGTFPDDLLVLSCEEDYAVCVPYLEQGATIYSSELILNGIVSQKLEYDRYRLFTDHFRKTRSTIWMKKDSGKFLPLDKMNKD